MMKSKLVSLAFSTLLLSQGLAFTTPAFAKEYAPATGYEIVRSGEWRSEKGRDRLPWSRPVLIEDEFTGEQILAVYDKDYHRNFWENKDWGYSEQGHFSLWQANGLISVYNYQICHEDWCDYGETRSGAVKVEIKVGNQVFEAEKSGLDFKLPADIGLALVLAAEQKNEIWIRAAFERLGKSVTWRMGPNTITALSEIFAEYPTSEHDSVSSNCETEVVDPALLELEAQELLMLP